MTKRCARYKPGDHVKIRDDLNTHCRYNMDSGAGTGWVAIDYMVEHAGEICEVRYYDENMCAYALVGLECVWTDEMFDPGWSVCDNDLNIDESDMMDFLN